MRARDDVVMPGEGEARRMPSAKPRIFVSHSHQDNTYCREYVNGLRTQGCDVWYDEHNLGWGALRPTIEREMPQREHFVAIFSPAAVGSEWVNAEIDAAMELLREGTMRTLTFVVAEQCVVPLLLRRWKRIEQPGGAPVSIAEAVNRTLLIVSPAADPPQPQPRVATPPAPQPPKPSYPLPDIPARLANLGYRGVNRAGAPAILPPLVSVAAGSFLMGTDKTRDKAASDNETPQHRVELAAYQIGKYPVTVAEYALAVRAGAVREPPTFAGVTWQSQLQHPDHPVVCVSWQDAQKYLVWLREATGQPDWRLPSEAQWEKAARWDAARGASRIYPWGDSFDTKRCNTLESGIGTTTPIGSYPASDAQRSGASPCGAEDLAGNVWEWTNSVRKPYPYTPSDGREAVNSTGNITLRGGSWYYVARYARAAYRVAVRPDLISFNVGFRLVVVAPGSFH